MKEKWSTLFNKLFGGQLHHAHVIKADFVDIKDSIVNAIESRFGIKTHGNPDVFVKSFDSFGIDDGREIQELQSLKSTSGEKKFFIISFNSITTQAQNSLLKMFEEPTDDTHFFVVTKSSDYLLPTLLSRVHLLDLHNTKTDLSSAREFLALSVVERLGFIEDMVENKDKMGAIGLLDDVLMCVSGEKDGLEKDVYIDTSEDLLKMREYLNDSSASVKFILGHVSLTLPTLD